MKQRELLELIQQHHPNAGETEIRKALNRAQDDFSAKTEILESTYASQETVADQRYYPVHEEMLRIKRVEINDQAIDRLVGPPPDNSDVD